MTNWLVIVMQYDELQKIISNSDNDQYDAAVLGADSFDEGIQDLGDFKTLDIGMVLILI